MGKSYIYTRTGDDGTTSLAGGERISKSAPRLEAYGTLDEFSSTLGVILSAPDCPEEIRGQLTEIQNRLFDVGGYLATLPEDGAKPAVAGLDEDTTRIEGWIDALDEQTPKVRAFVLPGGSPLNAAAHVARTVCRRAERRIYALASTEWVDPQVLRYVNRLSDYLFILARYFNFMAGVEEIVWKPKTK